MQVDFNQECPFVCLYFPTRADESAVPTMNRPANPIS